MKIWGTFLLLCAVVVTVTSANMRNDILLESALVDAYKTAYNDLRRLVQSYTKTLKDQVNVGITNVSSACNKEIILKLLKAEQDTLNTLETDLKECFKTAKTYQGKISITQEGIQCQRWDSQSPHKHHYNSSHFPDHELSSAENYCRTPEFPEPWCYTTDPRMKWDYCGIPECNTNNDKDCGLPQSLSNAKPRFTYTSKGARATYVCNSLSGSTKNIYCPVSQCNAAGWSAASVSCSEHDCFIKSTEYTGKRSCTSSGRTCMAWTSV
ncbi:hypothetical protein ACJMK2_028872, partial [Sinanodonta woodiana]